jgi:hypothetical protein
MRFYAELFDPDNDPCMTRFNELWHEFMDANHFSKENPPDWIGRTQAADFLDCSGQDLATMVYRKNVRSRGKLVFLDDVVAKKMLVEGTLRTTDGRQKSRKETA